MWWAGTIETAGRARREINATGTRLQPDHDALPLLQRALRLRDDGRDFDRHAHELEEPLVRAPVRLLRGADSPGVRAALPQRLSASKNSVFIGQLKGARSSVETERRVKIVQNVRTERACVRHARSVVMNAAASLYIRVCAVVSVASMFVNSAWRNDSPRLTYLPLAFISMASISRKPTPRFFIADMNLSASANGVPTPQNPNRCMYAMFPISLMPVADRYTTLAFGHRRWSSMTHCATFVPPSPDVPEFFALWHSSKRTHPSASAPPNHSTIWSNLLRLLVLETSVEYVRNSTPSRFSRGVLSLSSSPQLLMTRR